VTLVNVLIAKFPRYYVAKVVFPYSLRVVVYLFLLRHVKCTIRRSPSLTSSPRLAIMQFQKKITNDTSDTQTWAYKCQGVQRI